MAHDWGVTVPAEMTTERMIEMRDGLASGSMKVKLPDGAADHELFETWSTELRDQMIAAYDREIQNRRH